MLNLRLPFSFLGSSITSSRYMQSPPELSNASDTEMLKWGLSRIKYLITLSGLLTCTFLRLHLTCICTFISFRLAMLNIVDAGLSGEIMVKCKVKCVRLFGFGVLSFVHTELKISLKAPTLALTLQCSRSYALLDKGVTSLM